MAHIQSKDGAGGSFQFETPLSGADFNRLVSSIVTDFDLSADESQRRVTLTLKDDLSLLAAIARFQIAVTALHDIHAIGPATLKRWASDARFHGICPPNGRLSLEVAADSCGMSRQHQDQIGLNNVRIAELVLGDLGFVFLTGKHLLSNGTCRGADGAVLFHGGVLRENTADDGTAQSQVFASRRVSCI
jgi:hypothetical protein